MLIVVLIIIISKLLNLLYQIYIKLSGKVFNFNNKKKPKLNKKI